MNIYEQRQHQHRATKCTKMAVFVLIVDQMGNEMHKNGPKRVNRCPYDWTRSTIGIR